MCDWPLKWNLAGLGSFLLTCEAGAVGDTVSHLPVSHLGHGYTSLRWPLEGKGRLFQNSKSQLVVRVKEWRKRKTEENWGLEGALKMPQREAEPHSLLSSLLSQTSSPQNNNKKKSGTINSQENMPPYKARLFSSPRAASSDPWPYWPNNSHRVRCENWKKKKNRQKEKGRQTRGVPALILSLSSGPHAVTALAGQVRGLETVSQTDQPGQLGACNPQRKRVWKIMKAF